MSKTLKLTLFLVLLFSLYGGISASFARINNNADYGSPSIVAAQALSYQFSRFLGGNESDGCWDVALDSGGNIVVTGNTESLNFPTTTNAYDTSYNGGYRDAIVAKIDSQGNLVWSTFLGGFGADLGLGIAVDDQDNVLVCP